MAEDERAEIFTVLSDLTLAVLDAYPDVCLVLPKGWTSIRSGFSKSFTQKSMPGLFIDAEDGGFSVTLLLSVGGAEPICQVARRLQKELSETFSGAFPGKIRAVNLDILKTTRS